jgi:hypothetical protein
MSAVDALELAGQVGGLLFAAYASGRGAKGAAAWLRRRRAGRDERMRRG